MANTMRMGDAWDLKIATVDVCGDSFNLNITRDVTNVKTNCGNDVIASGVPAYTFDISGPLGFGAGSTEATLWTSITATTAEAWEWEPDGTDTESDTNPILSGTSFGDSFSISASVGSPITYSYSAQGTNATGMPARDVTP